MSNSVDQRIVQMMFDNSQFEKGVSSTLQSLKSLDEGLMLKKGSTGIEQVQKSIDGLKFDNAISQTTGFEKALGSLKSTAGGVFSSIMDAVGNMSTGVKVVTGLLTSGVAGMMVSGAWKRASNINMAEFKLSGMYEAMGYKGQKAADMVALAMQNASDAVDGTAYALDSAVMAASNLAASGVQAGDQLEGTLRSIAGLAAMSGRDYDSVAQIVSTVAGQGKLMTMQLRQFEMSGLNVAAVLADAFGTTEEAVRDMVTDGKVSFEVFSQVMEEKFAGAAAKANETFEGSLANIRAALSRTLATFFVYGQKGMVPIFNGIRVAINGINTALGPLLGENGVFTQGVYKALTKTGNALKKWAGYTEEYVKDAEGNMKKVKTWFHQEEIDKMTRFFQGIADGLKTPIDILAQVLPNAMLTFMYVGGIIREVVRLFGELIAPVFTAFSNVFSDNFFGMLTGWIAGLVKHIYDLVSAFHIGRVYGAALEGVFTALFSVVKAVSGVVGAVFTVAFRIALDVIFAVVKGIEIVLDILGTFIDMFSWAGEVIARFIKRTVKTNHTGFGLIAKTFTNLAKGAKLLLDVISGKEGAFDKFAKFVGSLDKNAGETVKTVGEAFEFLGYCLHHSGDLIRGGAKIITDSIYDLIKPVLKPLRESLWNIGDGLVNGIKAFGQGITEIAPQKIKDIAKSISDFINSILPMKQAAKGVNTVGQFLATLKENIASSELYQEASKKIKEFADAFHAFSETFRDSAENVGTEIFNKVKMGLEGLMFLLAPLVLIFNGLRQVLGLEELDLTAEGIENSFSKLKDALQPLALAQTISDALLDLGGNIVEFVGSLKDLAVDNVFNFIDDFKDLLTANEFEWLSDAFQGFSSRVSDAWSMLMDSFSNGTFGIQAVQDFVTRVSGAFSRLGGRLGKLLPNIGDLLTNFFTNELPDIAKNITDFLGDSLSSVFKSIGDFFKNLSGFDIVKDFGLHDVLMDLSNFFSTAVPGKISEIAGAIGEFVSAASSIASSAIGVGFVALTTGVSEFFTFMSGLGKGALDVVSSTIDKLSPLVGLLSTYFSLLSNAFERFKTAVSDAWTKLTDSFKDGSFSLDAVGSFVETVKWQFKQLGSSIEYYLGKAWDAVSRFFSENLGTIKEDIKAFVVEGVESLFQSIGDFLGNLASMDKLKDLGLSEPLESLADFFTNVAPEKAGKVAGIVSDFIGEVSSGAFSVAGSVFDNVSNAMKQFFDFLSSVGTRLSNVKDALVDAFGKFSKIVNPFTDFFGAVGRAFDAFFDSLDSGVSVEKALESLWYAIQRSFERLIHRVVPIVTEFVDSVRKAFEENFSDLVKDFGAFIGDALGNVPKAIGDALGTLDSLGVFEGLKKAGFEKPLKALEDFFQNTAPAKIKELGTSISEFFAPALEGLFTFAGNVSRIFADADFLTPLTTFGSSIGDAIKTFFDSIDGQEITVDSVKTLAHSIADAFGQFLSEEFFNVLGVGGKVFGEVVSSISSPLSSIGSFAGDKLSKVGGFIGGFFEVIKSFDITGILKNFDFSALLNGIKDLFGSIINIDTSKLSGIKDAIGTVKDIIKSFLGIDKETGLDKSMLRMDSGSVWAPLFQKYFGDTGGLDGAVKSIGETIKKIFEGFKKFVNDPIGTVFDVLAQAVNTFADKYKEFRTKINTDDMKVFVDDVVGIAKHAAGLIVLWEVVQMFENVGHFASSMARMADSFRTLAFELKQLSQDARRFIRTQAILNIAIAIGILIAAMALLVHVLKNNDSGDIMAALVIIEMMLIELAGIMVVISLLKFKPSKIAALSSTIYALAIAVAGLALVVTLLGGMDKQELLRGVLAVEAIMAMFGLLLVATSLVPTHFADLKGTFLGIAASLLIITYVIQILGTMDNGVLAKGGLLLIGLMALLVGLSAAIQHFTKGATVGAKSLIEMAAAILVLSFAIGVLAMIPTSRLEDALSTVIYLIVWMTASLIALTRFTQTADLAGTSAALIGFAAAIGLIAVAVGMLSMVGSMGGDLMAGTISVLAVMTVMMGVIIAISAMGPEAKKAAKALRAFSFAIGVLTVAVLVLSLLPISKVAPAMLLLSAMILVFAGSLTFLVIAAGTFEKGAGLVIGLLIALAAVAVAFAYSVVLMGNSTPMLLILAVAIGVMAVALAFLVATVGRFLPGAILVIGVLLSMGATALMFAYSVNIMAEGLGKLAVTVPMFARSIVTSLNTLADGLMASINSMARVVTAIGMAIVNGLLGVIPAALSAVGTFVLGILTTLIQYAPLLGEGAIMLVEGLIEGIASGLEAHGGDVLAAIGHLFDVVVQGVLGIFSEALTSFGNWLADLTGFGVAAEQAASETAANMSEEASKSADESNTIAEDTGSKLDSVLEKYEERIPGLKDAASRFSGAGVEGMKEGAEGFNFMEALGLDGESMDMNLAELGEKAKEMGVALPENITTMIENGMGETSLSSIMDDQGFIDTDAATEKANEAGVTVAEDGWGGGLQEGFATVDVTGLIMGEQSIDIDTLSASFFEAGEAASSSFSQGFSDGLVVDGSGPVKKAADAMKMEGNFNSAGLVDGKAAVSGLEKGLKDFSSKAKNASSAAKKEIENAKSGLKSTASNTGSGLVEGLISGINSQIPSLEAAVQKVIDLADKAAKKKAEINSPSKLFAKIGSGLIEGMILGMSQMSGSLKTASEDSMDLAISTAAAQASYLTGLLDDIEDQPVIRPILDLTDYNAGLAQMRGLDTYSQMISAQSAMRGLSLQTQSAQTATTALGGANISIYLNYDASADANQIVMDIANGLEARLAMEGA